MARTTLEARVQPGGIQTFIPGADTTGEVFFVHSGTGTDAAGGGKSSDSPLATLDYAIGLCTANKGDVIYLMPGHAETTTAIALDVAGVKIVGLGFGAGRPTLTATTAATDLINVTAANCAIENVRLLGAASGNTALLDGSSAATDFLLKGCELVPGATPLSSVTWSGTRFVFLDCTWRGSANGPDYAIDLEAHLKDWVVKGCRFLFGAFGLDNAVIRSATDAQEGYVVQDCIVVGIDTLLINFASSSAGPPDGLMTDLRVMYSAPIASVEDGIAAATSKGVAFANIYAADAAGGAGAAKIPLTTVS